MNLLKISQFGVTTDIKTRKNFSISDYQFNHFQKPGLLEKRLLPFFLIYDFFLLLVFLISALSLTAAMEEFVSESLADIIWPLSKHLNQWFFCCLFSNSLHGLSLQTYDLTITQQYGFISDIDIDFVLTHSTHTVLADNIK